jgi:excisionase family DNA binding protein
VPPPMTTAVVPDDGPLRSVPVVTVPAVQAAIDQVLHLIDDDAHRLATRLGPAAAASRSVEQLRAGSLGPDLLRLALVADGRLREPREHVLAAIESVVGLLFWPAGADDYVVPRTFWATDLGRLLARAKYRAFGAADLVGIGVAARQLGVSRPTVYRWIDDRTLDAVRDDVSGRTYVLRNDVDQRRLVAEALTASA